MFSLYFHYEDVSRQDPLLKPNHANVMEVPWLFMQDDFSPSDSERPDPEASPSGNAQSEPFIF
jgi:hypothetical protein